MDWRFTLLHRLGSTVIEEPVGFDQGSAELNRDLEWHGVFFSPKGDSYEFRGVAQRILKAEYDTYGAEGDVTLVIEDDCGAGYEETERARFDFNKYKFTCADGDCYVRIPLEKTGEIVELRNRLNQKVNLEATLAFDETTALVPYNRLAFDMTLPSKGILIQNKSEATKQVSEQVLGAGLYTQAGYNYSGECGMIEVSNDNIISSEIGGFGMNILPSYVTIKSGVGYNGPPFLQANDVYQIPLPTTGQNFNAINIWPKGVQSIVNWGEGFPNYQKKDIIVPTSFRLKGKLDRLNVDSLSGFAFVFIRVNKDSPPEYLYINYIFQAYGGSHSQVPNTGVPFDFGYNNPTLVLHPDDELFMIFTIIHHKTVAQATDQNLNAFRITYDDECFFDMRNLSKSPATKSKVFAINEAISRVAESITNDKLRAYSQYFGRTDSQPYALSSDGCGGLEVITDGIRIRGQENKIPGTTNLFAASLQDIFEGINPIHNIGMGIEVDPNRIGHNRLRCEPWTHFYNNTVVMSCTGVARIDRECYEKEIFSTFQFGYAKWEAEEYTGLDEFLTKRNYRTTLSQVKNDLIKLSKFIASGYALEITRRKGSNDSKDWRYDKETFIICCQREATFVVKFDPVTNTISFDFIGNPLVAFNIGIGGTFPITVAGSVSNNATFTATGYDYNANRLVFHVYTPILVTEESAGITFVGAVLPANDLYVELGNVATPTNIIDPDTLYNYRISPIRNAMRWMNRVLASYKQFSNNSKIIFTDGDGNYFASGMMKDPDCRMEGGVLVENQTIDPTSFADPTAPKPPMAAERVIFSYPMNSREFKHLEANPYGLIYFQNECDSGHGWIDSINYNRPEGTANFILIPKAP